MTVPYTFATATTTLPLSQLDANFSAVGQSANIAYTYVSANAVTRTASAKMSDIVSVKDFGAVGNGSTDDSSALNSVGTTTTIYIPNGTYVVNSNVTFNVPVNMEYGAVLKIATGVIVNFNKGFNAGIYQVFNCIGTGSVTFNAQFLSTGYPEWWGAQTNTSAVDNIPYLNACVIACQITQLQASDYWINTTWYISTSNRIVRGINPQPGNNSSGYQNYTRVLVQSATLSTIYIGSTTQPANINSSIEGVYVDFILATRSISPTPAGHTTSPCGFKVQWALNCELHNCISIENTIAFSFAFTVGSKFFDCYGFRSAASNTGNSSDFYIAYFLYAQPDGNGTLLESCYWDNCAGGISRAGLTLSDATGVLVEGTYTDCTFNQIECDGFDTGFHHNQAGNTTQSIDNHIVGGVFDQCDFAGLFFEGLIVGSIISVSDVYVVCSTASTATAGFYVLNSSAQVSFVNCQYDGRGGSNALGIAVTNSRGVSSTNNMICDSTRPYSLSNSYNCSMQDSISNPIVTTVQAAVNVSGGGRHVLRPMILGTSTNKYPSTYGAVNFTSSVSYSEVNMSGVDPTNIQGGSANKLIYNSTQITSTGVFGTTNLASGIMT